MKEYAVYGLITKPARCRSRSSPHGGHLGLGPGIHPPVRHDPAVPRRPAAVAALAAGVVAGVIAAGLVIVPTAVAAWAYRGVDLLSDVEPDRGTTVDDDLRCVFRDRAGAHHPGGPRGRRGGADQIPAHEHRRAAADQVARGSRHRRGRVPDRHGLRHAAVSLRHDLGGPDHAARPDRDRDRDPALPPVRDRPARQPHHRLGDRDRRAGRGVRRRHRRRAPGGPRPVHQGEHPGRRGIDADRVALFQPLRRRVQRAVDRRFNRAGYDAQRTTATFGESLRHDTDIGAADGALVATAVAAVQPATAAVWLRGTMQ